MEKKWWFVVGVSFVVLVLALVLIAKPREDYSDNPQDWVEETIEGTKDINEVEITKGSGQVDEIGLIIKKDGINALFNYDGLFDGEYFFGEYIIEGTIIERIEDNGDVSAFIFVDEDWKERIGPTNIIWGYNWDFVKEFEFNEISTGVYMDEIIDDKYRFEDNFTVYHGGIMVGDITMLDVENQNTDNVTLMRIS